MMSIKSYFVAYAYFFKLIFPDLFVYKMNRLNFYLDKVRFTNLSGLRDGLLAIFIGHVFGISCTPRRNNQNHDNNNLFHLVSSILFDKVKIIPNIVKVKHNFAPVVIL